MIDRTRSRGYWLAALALGFAIVLVGTLAAGASAGAPDGVCASIDKLGLEKQTNINAARILTSCERGEGGFTGHEFSALRQLGATAPDLGGVDKDVTAGSMEVAPHVTQSETQTWAEGNTTVVTYNDSRPRRLVTRAAPTRKTTARPGPTSPRGRSAPATEPASAIRSSCTTGPTPSGSQSSSHRAAVARVSASGGLLTALPGRPAPVRTTAQVTIASPAGSTTTRRARSTDAFTSRGTTSRPGRTSTRSSPTMEASPGAHRCRYRPARSSATCRSQPALAVPARSSSPA